MEIKNVAVIGAGTMGNGIAHVFAQNGFYVQFVDIKEEYVEKGISVISKNLDRQIKKRSFLKMKKKTF
ncbi:MAG: 3-hydroxyacyl-CoA dehydrogenase NAD-binding domain-containing protein [Melioribacteraceae bacterium]|nr:3-hydroxyacyl-CoA dehydrogenase NAD-binding domain-containing protein [Melioribacteraceae bacterium]